MYIYLELISVGFILQSIRTRAELSSDGKHYVLNGGKLWCVNCVALYVAIIDHFTVVGLVTWPLNGSEARGDLVLIQTCLLLLCKSSSSYAN